MKFRHVVDALDKPKAILFDWDGTIIRLSRERFHTSCTNALVQLGYAPLKRSELKETGSITESFMRRIRCPIKLKEARELFYKNFCEDRISEKDLMIGARNLLKKAKDFRIPMGVVSNLDTYLLYNQLKMVNLNDQFEVIVGAEEGEPIKPDTAPLLKSLKSLKLLAGKDIWFIGDTLETDIKCANAARCTSFLVNSQGTSNAIKPDIYLESLSEFEEVIEKVISKEKIQNYHI
jgi:phosphoglycolate phosphatase-like HAD superfamily hydrolase